MCAKGLAQTDVASESNDIHNEQTPGTLQAPRIQVNCTSETAYEIPSYCQQMGWDQQPTKMSIGHQEVPLATIACTGCEPK